MSESAEIGLCPHCGNKTDNCSCTCPYCAEIENCDCAIGIGAATGGG